MNTILTLLVTSLAAPPAPILQCPAPAVEKGEVKSGPALLHTFELTHRGAGTLTITRVEGACGCIRQSLSSGSLQPGETAKLTLEVNTLTQPEGTNRWQVAVAYKVEAAGQPTIAAELSLRLSATLARLVAVTPPQLAFSTSAGASQEIRLNDSRPKPLSITKATTTSPLLVVELKDRIALPVQGIAQTIAVSLSPDYPVGHRDETIVLLTNDPEYAELRIPVRILKRAASEVAAAPQRVVLNFGKEQKELSTLVQLRRNDGKMLEIASAESDHPGVTLKWSKGVGAVETVRVTITEIASSQSGNSTVRIKLGERADQEVVIPVSWQREK